ncbi:simple sugar transport system ATP-binding protein [Catenuloplanes nepalensis]|uniref:Simple sugar transport system ATP-binding protein n=1 Tax=Catenuloplanes nepalensis TaxID=587533 RepID=A0ABT9MUJ2_9ACTN|nr:ABC transporter ATP-binding protein [Catenuloplanes nepalensis]MDP9795099.1 simple sugar transport system ATP-binding protein [Catenuloplanes nepalensis]
MAPEPALRLRGITKRYGAVVACDRVDLTVERGEIHGLLGENGAGKSTLMRILLGLETRDSGTVERDGRAVTVAGPRAAAALGIGMVHQHLSLVDPLTVWENVVLGDSGPVRRAAARAGVRAVAERYGLTIDPDARVGTLSAGERQRVELLKCLRRDPAVLIMDEPTSVLTRAESAELFTVLRRVVAAEHRAVVLISHKLTEITTATDRVTVMRAGRVVLRRATAATTPAELAREMVGREVTLGAAVGVLPATMAPVASSASAPAASADALRLDGLTVRPGLDGLRLTVRPGEIVGLYGAEGSGQKTLGDVLSGLVVPDAGTVEVAGVPVDLRRPGALLAAGLGIVPEDRHRTGVVLDLSVAENLVMTRLGDVSGRVFVDRPALRRRARALADEYGITAASLDAPLRSLSGGNQQRVVLARELSGRPRVLVAAHPARGLDVGAVEDLYARLRRCADDGIAVLVISTELAEILTLTTRLAVIFRGRIVGELPTAQAGSARLGLLIGGAA